MDDATVDLGIDDLTDAVEVGAGGFGTVYKARQASLRRDVAVKIVTSTVKDEKVRIRFEREIQAMGMLSGHPNIVTVYDSGFTAKGNPYILMAYEEQGSLGDRLDRSGPVAYADVLTIMVKVSGALETAHQAGILHRDLKPENVLVSGYGEPKLGDFGIARLKGGPETGTSSLTASIEHVAPELLEAKPPDTGSDLYALGSTMFKLLTGTAAFVRPGDESIVPALTRIRDEPVPDLRQRGIPAPVAEAVERAMAKDSSDRYPSAAAMGRALREVQQQLGLPATPMPVREEEAAKARESTRTINSDDLISSIDDIRASQRVTAEPTAPPLQPPAHPSQPLAAPGYAGYQSQPLQTPSPGPPPGAGPGYQQVPPHTGGYPPQPPASGGGGQWGKVLAGIGAVTLVAVVGVAIALAGGGGGTTPSPAPTTDPPTPPPTTPDEEVAEYADFDDVRDDSGTLLISVPAEWEEIDGGPWINSGEEVGEQIVAAPDLEGFRTSWRVPGVIFSASNDLAERFDGPGDLLDAVGFGARCTFDGRQDYSDPAYSGFREDYSECGGIDTRYTLIAAEPATGEQLLLVQVQRVDDRDDAALERIIETFFVPPADDDGQ